VNEKQEQMILDNLNLIHVAIKQLNLTWRTKDEWQDYYDNGLIGLIRGVKAFENNKGIKPSTFLIPCIKNEIKHHITIKKAKKRINEFGETISLNEIINKTDEKELMFFLKDEKINIEKQVQKKIELETIVYRINKMKNIKDALVLKMYFGLDGFTERSMSEISEILKVSEQMISVRFNKGIEKIKKEMEKEWNNTKIKH
jgi:RNA polymerase sigma factor (sigma-70 family)